MTTTDQPLTLPHYLGMPSDALRELLTPASRSLDEIAADAGLHLVRDVDADPALAAIALAADYFPVLTDCGHVDDYGQVTQTQCELILCGDCAAEHTCTPCDAAARS